MYMHHFLSNVLCLLIPNRTLRDKVRVMIRYPQTLSYIRYVRKYAGRNGAKIKTRVGRGCRNFVVVLDDKWVFKFPLFTDGHEIAYREKRILDALMPISPIKIPKMEIIHYKDIVVRKYEFANGMLLSDVEPSVVAANRGHITRQIANMLYVIGKADPKEIRDLKDVPGDKPGYLYGWFQGDVWQNFMLDENCNITYFIDWEDTKFQSFMPALRVATRTWEKRGYRYMGIDVLAEYSKLYFQNQKSKKQKK